MELIDAVKKRSEELKPLYDRRKYDIETIYNLKKYTYARSDGKTKGFESMTVNTARVYADKVIQLLNTADLRYDIQPADLKKTPRPVCSVVEDFLKFCRAKADEYNIEMGQMVSHEADSIFSCLEGAVSRIVLVQRSGKLYKYTILAVDPIDVVWQFGKEGYRGLFGNLTKDVIYEKYEFEIKGKGAEVLDVFTDTERVVTVAGQKIPKFNYKHKLRKNPFLYVGVPTSPVFSALSNAVAFQNESIFSGIRSADLLVDLTQELHRSYSEWKTQNTMGIRPPLQFQDPDGDKPEIEKPESGIDSVVSTGKGEFKLIPNPTFANTYMQMIAQQQKMFQEGTLPSVEFGQLSLHGISALALNRLKSAKDQIFVPRISAENYIEKLTAYHFIEQTIDGGYQTEFDGGYELPFDIADLKHDFVIKVSHYAESPEQNLEELQMAAAARAEGLPDEHIYTHQLPVDDVDKLMRQKREQELITENLIARRLAQARAHTVDFEKTKDPFHLQMAQIALAEIGYEFKNGKFTEKSTQLPSQPSPSNVLETPTLGAPRNEGAVMQRGEDRLNNIKQV